MKRLYNVVIVSKETDEIVLDKKVVAESELKALEKVGGNVFDATGTFVNIIIQSLTTINPDKLIITKD